MKIKGKNYRTIWLDENNDTVVCVIDQRHLPHQFIIEKLTTVDALAIAIKDMHIRGAGLIGATAAYGMYLAAMEAAGKKDFRSAVEKFAKQLKATRPTAINLEWAVNRQLQAIAKVNTAEEKMMIAKQTAAEIADEDAAHCKMIGIHGVQIIEEISKRKNGEVVNILTHCNAGWLAFVDHGSATAPIYEAFERGIKVHVWVDETRPRNQGASLTAWELLNHGVPHTIIADNTGGHLMQHGLVDLVITGADRVACSGDAANKIGTYLKALAAKDNNIPFYVAFPSSTFDWKIKNGVQEIPIEERGGEEVKYITGLCDGEIKKVLVTPEGSTAANYGFDVTPARLITGLITERGICKADEQVIMNLYPEKNRMGETGVIKYNCNWIKGAPPENELIKELNQWRDKLYLSKFIGMYPDGIGYGNISIREKGEQFIISGSMTGSLEKLGNEHYTRVTDHDISKNFLTAKGPIVASSESLTHAAIYDSQKDVNAVMHIHDLNFWKKILNKVPTTTKRIEYGTPAMALEVERLFKETNLKEVKIFAMAGHEEGIVVFGKDLNEAGEILFRYFNGL